jgi:uncharacterized membrane protein
MSNRVCRLRTENSLQLLCFYLLLLCFYQAAACSRWTLPFAGPLLVHCARPGYIVIE